MRRLSPLVRPLPCHRGRRTVSRDPGKYSSRRDCLSSGYPAYPLRCWSNQAVALAQASLAASGR